jgi:cytochrome b561
MLVAGSDRNARAWALFHFPLAPLVVLVGILGVIHDSWPGSLPHRGNLHVLFGVLLLVCVVARFYGRMHQTPRMVLADIRPFSRHLARLVYLLLYVLMFCRLIMNVASAAPPGAVLRADEDFQSYLGFGVLALVTIHVLAAHCQRNGRLR